MHVPASFVALPLLIGTVAGVLHSANPERHLPLCAAAAAVLALCAALAWLADGCGPEVALSVALGCLSAGVSLGVSGARGAYHPSLVRWFEARDPATLDEPARLEGVLREDASLTPYGASLTLDVRRLEGGGLRPGVPLRGGVRLSVGGAGAADRVGEWRAGRAIRVVALVRRPASYRNPGLPDEELALARRGVSLVGSIKSAALVEVVARGGAVSEAAASARAWTRAQLARHVGRWSPRSGALAAAILIGDRSGLSNDDERRLQEAGTYHVIAISGGNIAILTTLLLVAMQTARVPHRAAAIVAILVLVFYGQLTGSPASVSRAVIAAVVYLTGRVLDHRGAALNALAVAVVCALGVWPLAVFDAGFILSFGATLGILLGMRHLAPAARGRSQQWSPRDFPRRIARAAAMLLAATVCAELALAPAAAAIFFRITFAGLVLNFVAIPLMTIAQVASMAALVAAPVVPSGADACGYITHVAAAGLVESARLVDLAPWLSWDVPPPAWWLCVAYYVSCAAMLATRRHARIGRAGVLVSALVMLIGPVAASHAPGPPRLPGMLRVVFLDVGQGDATLVVLPQGHALLVDAGGLTGSAFDIGERVVAPALRVFGVRRLEAVVLTHGDPDHIGGALAVLRRFAPRAVWEGIPVPPHEGLQAIAALAGAKGASWRTVQAGDTERVDRVEIRVLHPRPPEWERQRVRNDDSIVVELRLGDVSILLPGDIQREGEHMVIPRLSVASTVILKAPHHGSATSSTPELIAAAHPAVVVFSNGRGNRFGHPAPTVVARYVGAGAVVFRTDQDGAVVLDTDGQRVQITTWSGRRVELSR